MNKEIIFKIEKISNGFIVTVEHDVFELVKKYFNNIEDIKSLLQNDLESIY